jgi:hypothetical protein
MQIYNTKEGWPDGGCLFWVLLRPYLVTYFPFSASFARVDSVPFVLSAILLACRSLFSRLFLSLSFSFSLPLTSHLCVAVDFVLATSVHH